jgi:phosphoserine phosphatase
MKKYRLPIACRQIDEAGTAPKDGVMVCGDSGNDIELFAVPGVRGCMVVNAHPELRKWCDAHRSPTLFQARTCCCRLRLQNMMHAATPPRLLAVGK